jgi:hypothetical protein
MKLAEQEAKIGKKMEKKQRRARRNAMRSRQEEIQNDTLNQEGAPQATMLKSSPRLVILLNKAKYLSRKKVGKKWRYVYKLKGRSRATFDEKLAARHAEYKAKKKGLATGGGCRKRNCFPQRIRKCYCEKGLQTFLRNLVPG